GHLFWELAALGSNVSGDTLRIELVRPAIPTPAGPYRKVVLTACAVVTVDIQTFGLGDQTFVRNTGNFTHAFVGEGGNVATPFVRVFSYSAKKALTSTPDSCIPVTGFPESGVDDRDFGMSPGVFVSDFISNVGVHVVSIATNFNGLTNLVRADNPRARGGHAAESHELAPASAAAAGLWGRGVAHGPQDGDAQAHGATAGPKAMRSSGTA